MSINAWESEVNELFESEMQYLESAADNIAVCCAELSAYLGARSSNSGHAEAMKFVISTRKKIRKALDYTYP